MGQQNKINSRNSEFPDADTNSISFVVSQRKSK